MQVRYAKEEELKNVKDIWQYCFNDGESFVEYYFNNKYKKNNTLVLDEGKEIVSSLQLNQYKISLNGKTYDTSYVVGVSTLPEVRGRGYMKNIMRFMLDELYKKGQLVSILMPIDYRLYRRYGYEHCYDQLQYDLDIMSLDRFKINGKMHKVDESHINSLVDINNTYLKDTNGSTKRDNDYYETLFKEVKSEGGHIYIHESHGYEGYIIYFLNDGEMFVRELFYKNIESLKTMLKFIYNHNTQCKKIIVSAPINDKLRFILDNPKDSEIKIKHFMMGRIINLKEFFNDIDVDKSISFSCNIAVHDEFISENDNTFKMTVKNGKIELVETDDESDISLSINAITQLAFSYMNIKEVLFVNDVDESSINKEVIDMFMKIFIKKNNYINEYV